MKKFAIVLMILCLALTGSEVVYGQGSADLEIPDNQSSVFVSQEYDSEIEINYLSEQLKEHAESHFSKTGKKITWAICSLCNHSRIQFYVFYDRGTAAYLELINSIDEDIDFIQFGGLLDIDKLDDTKEAFKNDCVKAALDAVIPVNVNENSSKAYEGIKNSNSPVYWSVKENSELKVFTLEVAVGKYVINLGDTLSVIALRNNTTVERILKKNSNITNADVIFAGDYLVIK